MIFYPPSLEIPHEVWLFVLDRDGWLCQNENCINRNGKYDNLTVHHIIPKSANGLGTDPCNLITLCWSCHDKISLLKDKIEGCNVTNYKELMHREQCSFYEHDFKLNYIGCSHQEMQKQNE